MKRLILPVLLLLMITGCATSENPSELSVVTTSYVTFDLAREVIGEEAVTLLIKPGADAHTFEPTAQDMVTIENADLMIYTNPDMEPWVESLSSDSTILLNASQGIVLLATDEDDHHDHEEDDHSHDEDDDHDHAHDPHTWTSMKNAQIMVSNIRDKISEIDPDNADKYNDNAERIINELKELDESYQTVFNEAEVDTIVFLGHFGLNYLMHDYDMEYIALFESMSHESEPTVAQISSIIDTIQANELKVVFSEELSEMKIVQTIEEETGVRTLELNSMHNISQKQFDDKVSFIEIQRMNLANLKEGLAR